MASLAWIVGGSRGIGYACAEALGREGYQLAIGSSSLKNSEEAAKTFAEKGFTTQAFECDVTSEESVRECYRSIKKTFNAVPDILINSAGISPWSTFSETSIEEFDAVLSVNTRGLFLTSREVLNDMYMRGSGVIVQILSIASIKAYKNGAAYVASKFASLGFTNALREEARQHGVRVIAVFPGATETELWDKEERENYHDRMMQPEDIALAVIAAIKEPGRALIEEIVLRPILGDI